MDEPLFDRLSTVNVRATSTRFLAKEHFALNMDPGGKVMISYILDNFQHWFSEKAEEPIGETTLCSRELQRNASDAVILAELGERNVETTLTEVFSLMDSQRRGEPGILSINGWGNIFYIRDVSNVLRAVDCHWCDGGWNIEASRIGRLVEWPIRDRIVSRGLPDTSRP
jgi:hypothetical protein